MKKNLFKIALIATGISTTLALTSCDNSDNMDMTSAEKTITVENVVTPKDFVQSGEIPGVTFFAPAGHEVILPGESQSITFSAGKAQSLMFAMMYGASKDWFFASKQPGIKLFDDAGNPITGDVSSQIILWDNGSKNNTSGQAESKPIAPIPNINAANLVKANLVYNSTTSKFTLTITNTSGGTANETPLSPGAWAISNFNGTELINKVPFFTPNALSNPEITDIAEQGVINKMITKLKANTAIMTGLSPVLVVVYRGDKNPIYELGQLDSGKGLKEIAQFGNTTKLQNSLKSLPNVKGVYIAGSAPVGPGSKVMTNFKIDAGDKIAYATMFGFSNDWFYANDQPIDGNMKGDLTSKTTLFDSGTGVDQYPGAGNHQALFGGTPEPENVVISKVGTQFPVPPVQNIIKVTIN